MLKFFKEHKPIDAGVGDKKEWVPAKKVADVPFCEMELENDIVQTFTLIEHGDGTLKLKVEVRRIGG